jgi:peptide/nickel transport system ATP-binding protein
MPLLEIKDLRTSFFSDGRVLRAVDGVSLTIDAGETIALVGESGCGKSVTALSILGLVPSPPGRIVGGEILLEGRDLLRLDARSLRDVRGNRIGMIFQEPMTSLNPVLTVGNQIVEAIQQHRAVGRKAARRGAAELLDLVGLSDPHRLLDEYPHRLSGGMRQRVMIAMALSCEPGLLIADEPTTALDVTTQAQILDLLGALQKRLGMAMLFITHDLGVVARIARRVAVMYAGRKVEEAAVADLIAQPRHPYTQGLLASLPNPEAELDAKPERLKEIPGMVPPPHDLPEGCAFAPRCPLACDDCRSAPIELRTVDARSVACIRA